MDVEPKKVKMSRVTHLFFLLLMGMCVAFLVWSYYGHLDIVSFADGQVIPSGRVKHIQHLEGGIVKQISVKEGDSVQKGQALIELEQIRSGASLEEIQMRINALRFDVARFTAQMNSKEKLIFSSPERKKYPKLVKEALALFKTHQQSMNSRINKLDTIVEQKEQRIKTIQVQLENKQQRLPLIEEQLTLSADLLKDNLTTKYKHLELQRRFKETEGEILKDQSSLQEAIHALKETKASKNEILFTLKEEISEKLKAAKQELGEFSVRLKKFEDNLERTIIRSPINGVIKTLYLVTLGGVLKPGDTLADIVPSEEKLVVEAHLPISDIGYVSPGQSVFLQLPTADSRKFNKLKGIVVNVSPDTFTDDTGRTFYTVRIESERNYFESGDQKHMLYPGMVLMAHIHIGKRTVLEYIIDPLLKTLSFSLQER